MEKEEKKDDEKQADTEETAEKKDSSDKAELADIVRNPKKFFKDSAWTIAIIGILLPGISTVSHYLIEIGFISYYGLPFETVSLSTVHLLNILTFCFPFAVIVIGNARTCWFLKPPHSNWFRAGLSVWFYASAHFIVYRWTQLDDVVPTYKDDTFIKIMILIPIITMIAGSLAYWFSSIKSKREEKPYFKIIIIAFASAACLAGYVSVFPVSFSLNNNPVVIALMMVINISIVPFSELFIIKEKKTAKKERRFFLITLVITVYLGCMLFSVGKMSAYEKENYRIIDHLYGLSDEQDAAYRWIIVCDTGSTYITMAAVPENTSPEEENTDTTDESKDVYTATGQYYEISKDGVLYTIEKITFNMYK